MKKYVKKIVKTNIRVYIIYRSSFETNLLLAETNLSCHRENMYHIQIECGRRHPSQNQYAPEFSFSNLCR